MSLRIRQIKPAFWADAKLVRVPLDVRCFYIGLWQLADDDGWFEWEPEQIAVELHLRESFVRRATAVLASSERVIVHDCGHGVVPHLTEHQRLAVEARRVKTTHRQHLSGECPNVLRGIVWNGVERPKGTSSSYEEGNVKVRGGVGGAAADAASPETTLSEPTTKTTEFQSRVPRPSVAAGRQ